MAPYNVLMKNGLLYKERSLQREISNETDNEDGHWQSFFTSSIVFLPPILFSNEWRSRYGTAYLIFDIIIGVSTLKIWKTKRQKVQPS
jgi:hypothetical protein